MFEILPDYYNEFKCIADKCRHTCCTGWEIDIDSDSLSRYKKDGIKHISEDGEPHFILDENERCPYLNKNNLCNLIIEHGEAYLCQICKDHPRFRSFWETGVEIGLGLCCEAAVKLILTREKPMQLVLKNGDDINAFVDSLPDDEKFLWNTRNALLRKSSDFKNPMEARLYEYLIFRHIPDALYDGLLQQRIKLVDKIFNDITLEWESAETFDEKAEIARAYSEDVEYDTDKIDILLRQHLTL